MNLSLLLVMTGIVSFSYWLEEHTRWIAHISGVMLIIILAAILANSGIIPSAEINYGYAMHWMMPIGIILMLFSFTPSELKKIDKEMLMCFGVGAFGTMLGGIIAGLIFRYIIPAHYWQISGQLTASFVGGGENAIAVGTILGTPTTVFVNAFAGDNIYTSLWLLTNIFQGKRIKNNENARISDQGSDHISFLNTIDVASIAISVTCALIVYQVSLLLHRYFQSMPSLLVAGLLATLVTLLPIQGRLKGTYTLGSFLLSYFMFACGAISNVSKLFSQMSIILLFPLIMIAVHAVVIFGYARVMKVDKEIAVLASQSLIGGPATALALVRACKWRLAAPAVTLGMLGYAVGNYAGLLVAWILK